MKLKDRKFTSMEKPINGDKVNISISPCSWMDEYYGLQLKCTLLSTNETIYIISKIKYNEATDEDFDNLCTTLYLDTPCKCGNNRLRSSKMISTNRGDLCEKCFIEKLDKEFAIEAEEEKKEIEAQDKKMKQKGFNYKVTAWIHGNGDDQCVEIYYKTEPTTADIKKALKQSVVKDDYTIRQLA